jgi:hypothetical protein
LPINEGLSRFTRHPFLPIALSRALSEDHHILSQPWASDSLCPKAIGYSACELDIKLEVQFAEELDPIIRWSGVDVSDPALS